MKFPTLALFVLLASSSSAFVIQPELRAPTSHLALSSSTDNDVISTLTPELKRMTEAFRDIGDDKLRYKQLLYMANQLPSLEQPEKVMIPSNKVPGCLSTVYVDGVANYDTKKEDYIIDFCGESDGLLTKGLVALLVRYVRRE